MDPRITPPLEMVAAQAGPQTVWQALEQAVHYHAAQEAIVDEDNRLSYEAVHRAAVSVAASLVAAGIKRGDHVGICVGNGADWLVLFFGIMRAGGVAVPVNTRLRAEEIAYQLRKADVRLLFVVGTLLRTDFIEILRTICPAIDSTLPGNDLPLLERIVVLQGAVPAACLSYGDFLAQTAELPALPQPEDGALIQFTSGTTSLPKAVRLGHFSMAQDAYFVGLRMGIRPKDRYLCARPFFHVAGSTLAVVLACVHGVTLISMQRFVADEALRLLATERCTHTAGNDTMFLMMMGSAEFSRYRFQLRGSWAAVSGPILLRIVKEFGARETVTGYGLSEASPNIATSDYLDALEDRAAGWMQVHAGLEVRIADLENGASLPALAVGEIQVRGWCVMQGYYRDEAATAEVMTADGFLRTGDLGKLDARGRLAFVGRSKEIIRVGGENLAPSDLENTLHQHPEIRQAQVFALPDTRLIEVPAAYILLRDHSTMTAAQILDWLRPRVASFKLPRYVQVIESFESIGITASGKVQKRLLVEHALRAIDAASVEGANA